MVRLEVACFSVESAIRANNNGAERIELCENYAVGGLSPTLDMLRAVKRQVEVPVYVMVRPRADHFEYTSEEYTTMAAHIEERKPYADGFVFGCLQACGIKKEGRRIDIDKNTRLVALCSPLPCTFHRAFDETDDLKEALVDVARCGFKSILTSGGYSNAVLGAAMLADLVERASVLLITVIVGGGVRSHNLEELVRRTGSSWYHSAAVIDGMKDADEEEIQALKRICQAKIKPAKL